MRHEGAHVLRSEIAQRRERHPAAEMRGKKAEELTDIAAIGFDGFRRHPPLRAEMRQPMADLRRDFGCREGQFGDGFRALAHRSLTHDGFALDSSFRGRPEGSEPGIQVATPPQSGFRVRACPYCVIPGRREAPSPESITPVDAY